MTSESIRLVKESWEKVVPIREQAADLFYGRLFELDPSTRKLFPEDMGQQKMKLMEMLAVAVGSLDRIDQIRPALDSLGERHVDYHVQESHYATVGEALLWTLKQGLGDEFTADHEAAWGETYQALSQTMLSAAARKA